MYCAVGHVVHALHSAGTPIVVTLLCEKVTASLQYTKTTRKSGLDDWACWGLLLHSIRRELELACLRSSHRVRHAGTQTQAGLFHRTDQAAGVALPLQPKNRGSVPRNFGTVNANFSRVDCLSTENSEEPRTVNGTEIESIRTCCTLVALRGRRRAILPTSTHTRPVSPLSHRRNSSPSPTMSNLFSGM